MFPSYSPLLLKLVLLVLLLLLRPNSGAESPEHPLRAVSNQQGIPNLLPTQVQRDDQRERSHSFTFGRATRLATFKVGDYAHEQRVL